MGNEFPTISWLITGLKDGNAESWNELVALFTPGLLGKAKQLLNNSKKVNRRIDAEDLVNLTFAQAWEKHEKLMAQSTPQVAAFLLTALRYTFLNQCRSKNLEQSSPSWFAPTGENETPSVMLMSEEEEIKLHACLVELKPTHRKILVMRHMQGMKFKEIAEELEMTTSAVAGAARDGLKRLTSLYQSDGNS